VREGEQECSKAGETAIAFTRMLYRNDSIQQLNNFYILLSTAASAACGNCAAYLFWRLPPLLLELLLSRQPLLATLVGDG